MRIKFYAAVFAFAVFTLMNGSAGASIEESYNPGKPLAITPWYGKVNEAQRGADLDFITGMRPHHAGALTMSEEYLKDPKARNAQLKQLAKGIIRNQTFEIGMLDRVEQYQKAPADGTWRRIADRDLVQAQKFVRAPMPGPLDRKAAQSEVSKRDVQFAKAMVIHHQAAVDMANEYIRNPDADNGYLERMCLDIIVDQTQEIRFMNKIVSLYAGNPDEVKITADMIHGMDGMTHGHGAHAGHHAM